MKFVLRAWYLFHLVPLALVHVALFVIQFAAHLVVLCTNRMLRFLAGGVDWALDGYLGTLE